MRDSSSVQYQVLDLVHEFDLRILEQQLPEPIPLPSGIRPFGGPTAEAVDGMSRWLALLDMAIAPPMVRDALSSTSEHRAIAALLRYFALKLPHNESDRDKTDFIVTWLYRHPPTPDDWAIEGTFTQAVLAMLEFDDLPVLSDEYAQLLREFDFLREEVLDIRNFDSLMDSGVMQRVRDIKSSFGEAFYNPAVLAQVAEYNHFFGKRFDDLFHEATQQIKDFARHVQDEGGSELTRVGDDVMVKHLEGVKEQEILHKDYRVAQESFRKVSHFKKAVDKQVKARKQYKEVGGTAPKPLSTAHAAAPDTTVSSQPAALDPVANAMKVEEGKLQTMAEIIRNFVRAADPAKANVVPMRHGNFILSQTEVDAFRADFIGEKSFRADMANVYRMTAAVVARIETEIFEYRQKESSSYLWKPHADSLANLVRYSQQLAAQAQQVHLTAEKRGLIDKANAIFQSTGRLRQRVQTATELLSQVGSRVRQQE